MRAISKIAVVGLGGALVCGAAFAAAGPARHVMDVPLPGGSVAHIEYFGDIAPKVMIERRVGAGPLAERHIEGIERRRVAGEGVPAEEVSVGDLPGASHSVTVVTLSNGGKSCTRTTEVTSDGRGKAPKVVTTLTGDCDAAGAPPASKARPSAAPRPGVPVDHT